MQIAYASQRSIISFYIYGLQARLSDFFFSFKLFLQSVAGVLFSTVKFLYKKHGWKWKRPSKRRDEVVIKKVFFQVWSEHADVKYLY